MKSTFIVALEIGSSKIKAAVAEVTPGVNGHSALNLIALEEQKTSDDVRHGVISNVDAVTEAMNNLLERLEHYPAIAPRKIKGVYASIGGRSLSASPISVETSLPEEEKITQQIILDLANDARSQFSEYNGSKRDILQVCSGGFTNNGRPEPNPIGRYTTNIGGKFKIISARPELRRNLHRVISDAQHLDYDLVVRPTAIATLATTTEQRNKGCVLVDFGADTTTVVVFRGGDLQYLSTLPLGSRLITLDLMTLNYEEEEAENFKRNISSVVDTDFESEQEAYANEYVTARALEIISNIEAQISYSGFTPKELPAGIILTGLGARLKGFSEKLSEVTKLPVQIAYPVFNITANSTRLDQEEHLDILAILYKASNSNNIRECLTELPEQPATPVRPTFGNQQGTYSGAQQGAYGPAAQQGVYGGSAQQGAYGQQQRPTYGGAQPPAYGGAQPAAGGAQQNFSQPVVPVEPVRTPNPKDPFRPTENDEDILKDDDDIPQNSKDKRRGNQKNKEPKAPKEPKKPKKPGMLSSLFKRITDTMTYDDSEDQDEQEEETPKQ